MKVIKVTKDNFENEVLKSNKPVVADFNADWCGPCRMLKPVLDELAEENDAYKFVSINIDDEERLAVDFEISSIPCIVVIKNGKEVKRSVGFKPKYALKEFLEG